MFHVIRVNANRQKLDTSFDYTYFSLRFLGAIMDRINLGVKFVSDIRASSISR